MEASERRAVGPLALLHAAPVIIHSQDVQVFDPDSVLWSVLEDIAVRPVHLVVGPTWALEQHYPRHVLKPALDALRDRFEHVHIVVLAPSEAGVEALRNSGETPLWCSEGTFTSESLFYPIPGSTRRFDAVYDAAWADYKRHDLAGEIKSLALITYLNPRRCTLDYYQRAMTLLSHAMWLNPPWSTKSRHLSFNEVNDSYNAH